MSALALSPLLHFVLDAARWAPSGDNMQPWRFEPTGDSSFTVHATDTREHCVYDLDGAATRLALGALFASIEVAAAERGHRVAVQPIPGCPDTRPTFAVTLRPDAAAVPTGCFAALGSRTVQRRAMSREPITAFERALLERAAGPGFRLRWMATAAERLRVARLLFHSAKIRLTTRECFEVHRTVIEWNASTSETRIPDQAVGLDPLTLRLMRWVMGRWERVLMMNRWFMGTLAPRLQLDLLPGLACGAHFLMVAEQEPVNDAHWIEAGKAWQRLWLEAERLGLSSQPEMTPLIFARFHREGRAFSESGPARRRAEQVERGLERLFGNADTRRAVVLARLGRGPRAEARSLRRPLVDLLLPARSPDSAPPPG